jgi:hypothetical protein
LQSVFVTLRSIAGKPTHQGIPVPGTLSAWRFVGDWTALAFSIVATVSATHHDEGNAARVFVARPDHGAESATLDDRFFDALCCPRCSAENHHGELPKNPVVLRRLPRRA